MVDNEKRAVAARGALMISARAFTAEAEPIKENITDLMCNLMHLCRQSDVSVKDCVVNAITHFEEEICEEIDLGKVVEKITPE